MAFGIWFLIATFLSIFGFSTLVFIDLCNCKK